MALEKKFIAPSVEELVNYFCKDSELDLTMLAAVLSNLPKRDFKISPKRNIPADLPELKIVPLPEGDLNLKFPENTEYLFIKELKCESFYFKAGIDPDTGKPIYKLRDDLVKLFKELGNTYKK